MPTSLDVLFAAAQGTEAERHADGTRRIARRIEEDDAQKLVTGVEVVVHGMPSEQACLADLVQCQAGSRGQPFSVAAADERSLRRGGDFKEAAASRAASHSRLTAVAETAARVLGKPSRRPALDARGVMAAPPGWCLTHIGRPCPAQSSTSA